MDHDEQKFLDAEEAATQLLHTLERLRSEAASLKSSSESLGTVRDKLVGLIEATEQVARGSHEAVKVLGDIGSPEIMGRLSRLIDLQDRANTDLNAQSGRLEDLMKLTALLSDGASRTSKDLSRLTKLAALAVAGSIVAAILGIVGLLV